MSLSRKEKEELYLAYRLREQRQQKQNPTPTNLRAFEFRGSNLQIQSFITEPRPHEWILEGAAETGKTIASLYLLDQIARKYPNARGAIVRKWHVDLASTVLDIYKREFLDYSQDVRIFGGESPIFYDYPNGTRIWTAGIDRPGKVLSGALDFVYVNQAEELDTEDWETLSTRTTGRAGQIIPGLLFGDMNPTASVHWIYTREAVGTLKVFFTTHKDNPRLFDDSGNPTLQGQETIKRLSALTGVRRARLFEGKRAMAEGLVYGDVWSDENITEQAEYIDNGGEVVWFVDDGYSGERDARGYFTAPSHPRVFLLAQIRPNGIVCVFYESYEIKTLEETHVKEILALNYPRPAWAVVDKSAAQLRGRIHAQSIYTRPSPSDVSASIDVLRPFIGADENKVRKVLIHPRCKFLRQEMLSYRYETGTEKPVKEFDHGCDALRYGTWALRHNQ